jgi:ABC-2 type transport system ATP-binding protein
MLAAEELTKRFGAVRALNGFSLGIASGEVCGLVGHNGAGKTTFIDIVTGLTRPDGGTVTVAGRSPRQARHLLGVAPQEEALYLSASVRDNLRLFGGLAGLHGRGLRAAIEEVGLALGLVDQLDRPVGLLSGGQRRRVQAATALLHRPPVLLLDEPTVGADPTTRQALLALVRSRADEGAAVCYTTHYLPELADLGATLAVCVAGRVVERGSQARLLAGLPGHLHLSYRDGREEHVVTHDPTAELSRRLSADDPPSGMDIRPPTLDDLYESLAVRHA